MGASQGAAVGYNFYPRSPCGERLRLGCKSSLNSIFLSTLSLRRATGQPHFPCTELYQHFYPRSPCGERLKKSNMRTRTALFLSTLSLRRATHYDNYNLHCTEISIHALLAESDSEKFPRSTRIKYFYPRSPCGERRNTHTVLSTTLVFLSTLSLRRATSLKRPRHRSYTPFLSTLSLRRATMCHCLPDSDSANFYPRSPCGERLEQSSSYSAYLEISIHALLAESDQIAHQ